VLIKENGGEGCLPGRVDWGVLESAEVVLGDTDQQKNSRIREAGKRTVRKGDSRPQETSGAWAECVSKIIIGREFFDRIQRNPLCAQGVDSEGIKEAER